MSKSPKEAANRALRFAELIIYIAAIALASLSADMLTKYILGGLAAFSLFFVLSSDSPHAAHVLLLYPLLCLAHDFGHLYYALTTSVVAAATAYGPLKEKLNLAPWILASINLTATLGALGLSHPYADAVLKSAPIQAASSLPHAELIFGIGFETLLQWSTMQFFVRATIGSFNCTEATLVSQLLGAFMGAALANVKNLKSSNGYALVCFIAVSAWICFWFYEFITRLPQSSGVKLSVTSTFAIIIAGAFFPLLMAMPAKLIAFIQSDINYIFLGYWALVFVAWSTVIAILKEKISNTVARKGFHFMALCMFLPGMMLAPEFLRTSLCLAIALFCAVEFLRSSKILGSKIADLLTRTMNTVTNDRDRAGPLTMSHVYLLIGCGFSLIFSAESEATKLPKTTLIGPLLVLTIGDSFASIIGSKWGRHKWPSSSSRSIEGSIAAVASTLGAMAIFSFFTATTINWTVIGIATALTFALEAYLESIDNLVLPIFYFTIEKLIVM